MSRIVIIGGHGKVAMRLSGILATRGDDVTSLIRNSDHAAAVSNKGATPEVADVEKLSTAELTEILKDHDAVVWAAGAGGGIAGRTYSVDRDAAIRSMDAAVAAGVKRYVMVSYLGSRADHGVDPSNSFYAYAEAKAAADDYLRGTALDWTVLGPGRLTLETGTGEIEVGEQPHGDSVSRDDVAEVAAAVLTTASTIGKTIPFVAGTTPVEEALASLR